MYRNNFKHNKSIKEAVNRKEQEANFLTETLGLFPSFVLFFKRRLFKL